MVKSCSYEGCGRLGVHEIQWVEDQPDFLFQPNLQDMYSCADHLREQLRTPPPELPICYLDGTYYPTEQEETRN